MTRRASPANVPASVAARLRNLAHERGEDFQLVLTRWLADLRLRREDEPLTFAMDGSSR